MDKAENALVEPTPAKPQKKTALLKDFLDNSDLMALQDKLMTIHETNNTFKEHTQHSEKRPNELKTPDRVDSPVPDVVLAAIL